MTTLFHGRQLMLACLLTAALASPLPAAVSLKGAPAPNFALKSAGGANERLSEYRGQVVMLNFWASWCGPCRQEMPLLDALYRQYRPLGFVILGVNVDRDTGQASRLAERLGVTYSNLFDSDNAVSRQYQVNAMPTTVLIDRDGRVRHVHRGYRDGYLDVYQQQVRDLLRE